MHASLHDAVVLGKMLLSTCPTCGLEYGIRVMLDIFFQSNLLLLGLV